MILILVHSYKEFFLFLCENFAISLLSRHVCVPSFLLSATVNFFIRKSHFSSLFCATLLTWMAWHGIAWHGNYFSNRAGGLVVGVGNVIYLYCITQTIFMDEISQGYDMLNCIYFQGITFSLVYWFGWFRLNWIEMLAL